MKYRVTIERTTSYTQDVVASDPHMAVALVVDRDRNDEPLSYVGVVEVEEVAEVDESAA